MEFIWDGINPLNTFKMKRLPNKLAMALLRGAVALAGIACTLTMMLFATNLCLLCLTAFAGTYTIILIDEHLKETWPYGDN
jgi:hypothetical protein